MRYISTPPPTPPRLRGGERLRKQMRGGVPVFQASKNRYIKKWDAPHDTRLVAAILLHGLTHILTFNVSDFSRYSEITAIHPTAITP
ncbi:hypothetical protein BCD64_13250 [Nostoc sp. MBR 210]|nr:hypothetical protein BCD64_13250 [Nostoc sp. MBR 210]